MTLGLRGKILLIASAGMVVAMAAAIGASTYIFASRLTEVQLSRATAIARGLAWQLEHILSLGIDLRSLQGFDEQCAQAVSANDGLAYALVADADGGLVFHSDARQSKDGQARAELAAALKSGRLAADALADGTLAAMAAVSDATGNRVAVIVVAFPERLIDAERRQLVGWTVAVGVLAMAVGLGLLFVALSSHVIRPLSAFVDFIDRTRHGGEHPDQLTATGNDELGVMVSGFNRLLDRIDLREAELLLARDAAEAASRAKSTFLAAVSHEIRTPMNAIIAFTELARDRATDAGQREQLAQVDSAARQLLDIFNAIIELNRLQGGQARLLETEFDVAQLVANVINRVAGTARAKDLTVLGEIDPALPLSVRGDAARIGQLLFNFAANAVKFTSHGSVTLSARHGGDRDGRLLIRFMVQDTGIGIARPEQERMFDAFIQADGSTTRRFGGLGIGLATSRCLAELMGGEIGVDSRPGDGSRFWFTVPLARARQESSADSDASTRAAVEPADSAASSADTQRPARFAGIRVLLADHRPREQAATRTILAAAGAAVDLADDGAEAVAAAAGRRYDLVLLGLQMPVMGGLDASRAMRLLDGYGSSPIVAFAAQVSDSDRRRCLDAGLNELITLPDAAQELLATVSRWLPPR